MAFWTSWLDAEGYFCFSYFTLLGVFFISSSLNFDLDHSSKASQQEITKWALLQN